MASAVGRVARHARPRTASRWPWPFADRASTAAALRARLHLARGERILTEVVGAGSGAVVATERALYWRPPGAAWVRLGWEEISQIEDDQTNGCLVVTGLSNGLARRTALPVPTDPRLRALAQERISATRIVLTRIAIDGRELWVDGRRQPATGRLHWLVRLDGALDPGDPALSGKIDHALAELRASLGV